MNICLIRKSHAIQQEEVLGWGKKEERKQEQGKPREVWLRVTQEGSGLVTIPRKERNRKCTLTLLFVNARTLIPTPPQNKRSVRETETSREKERERERENNFPQQIALLNSLGQFQLGHRDVSSE